MTRRSRRLAAQDAASLELIERFATRHRLEFVGPAGLPVRFPGFLTRMGMSWDADSARGACYLAQGSLPGEQDGTVGHLTDGVPVHESTPRFGASVVFSSVPEASGSDVFVRCIDKRAISWLGIGGRRMKVQKPLSARFRIEAIGDPSEDAARRMLTPEFEAYLVERLPDACSFELFNGALFVLQIHTWYDKDKIPSDKLLSLRGTQLPRQSEASVAGVCEASAVIAALLGSAVVREP